MPAGQFLTAKALVSYRLSRNETNPDILVLTVVSGDEEAHYALDRRTAEHLSASLAQVAAKLSAPRHEN